MMFRLVAAAAVAATAAGPARSQNKASVERLTKEAAALKTSFDGERAKAQERAAARFTEAIAQVKRAKGDATDKISRISKLEAQREAIKTRGDWPDGTDMIAPQIEYTVRLNKSYAAVSRKYREAIDAAIKADDLAAAKALQADKVSIDRTLPGRDQFASNTKWHGTRTDGRNNVAFHLNVKTVDDTLFEGVVHQRPGVADHPIYEIRGKIDGVHITLTSSRQKQGKPRALAFDGIVMEGKIVLGVGGFNTEGRAVNGYVFLEKK